MKWTFLTNSSYMRGGCQTRTKALARSILERGDAVEFICFQANPYQDLADEFSACSFSRAPQLNTRSLRPRDVLAAVRALKTHNSDALFFCNSGIPDFLPFMLATRFTAVRHIVVHHGTDVGFPKKIQPRRYLGGLLPGFGLWRKELIHSCRLAFRSASVVLFNNEQQKQNWQSALSLPDERCDLWYPPLELDKFKRNEVIRERIRAHLGLQDSFVIGGVGELNAQKSFHVAIQAIPFLRSVIPNAKLVIAGQGAEYDALIDLIIRLDLREHVLLLGERGDVADLMNAFDVFCLPSTLTNETLGIVILEAMATEVPVVASNLPGPSRLAEDGASAVTFEPGNYEALADAIISLNDSPQLRQEMVARAKRQVEKCDRREVLESVLKRIGIH